jgi:hypothetical protein
VGLPVARHCKNADNALLECNTARRSTQQLQHPAWVCSTRPIYRPNLLRCWTTGTLPTSYYDTSDLKDTLERLVDFDRINARETRFSVGAVNVRTGNFAYFDNAKQAIRPHPNPRLAVRIRLIFHGNH